MSGKIAGNRYRNPLQCRPLFWGLKSFYQPAHASDLSAKVSDIGASSVTAESFVGRRELSEDKRLNESGLGLSGGQQQRLCIARAIASDPEVLLLDEPCSALDPLATGKIEDLINDLRGRYTILIVTHNMQQAARVSDYTAFMYLGRLIEFGVTSQMFQKPYLKETEDYVTGRFG